MHGPDRGLLAWPTTILTFYRNNFELVLRREATLTSHNRAVIDQAIGILMSRTGMPGRVGHGAGEVRRSWEGQGQGPEELAPRYRECRWGGCGHRSWVSEDGRTATRGLRWIPSCLTATLG